MRKTLNILLKQFSRINNLTFETRKTVLPKQVFIILRGGRSTKTSSTSLIILINGSRLRHRA